MAFFGSKTPLLGGGREADDRFSIDPALHFGAAARAQLEARG
jgi:hypothetical protein